MPNPLWIQQVQRYSRSFEYVNTNAFVSPFFFMAANTSGLAGAVLQYGTLEDTVMIAVSGVSQSAGFLTQDVKDLDSGAVKGYRNLNNTVENLGGPVGVLQGPGQVCFTRVYVGAPAYKDTLTVSSNSADGGAVATKGATWTSASIAVVEAVNSSQSITLETQQFSTTGNQAYIRIRTL